MGKIKDFLIESNKIERIYTEPTEEDIAFFKDFLNIDKMTIEHLCDFVKHFQLGAQLRNRAGMDVRVGNYYPQAGGPHIVLQLGFILEDANSMSEARTSPSMIHYSYEALHPFTDCNGRSGRALWAWQMMHYNIRPHLDLGFLHAYYYQTLE